MLGAAPGGAVRAEPMDFNLPAQTADRALLAFSQQAKTEVLFSSEDLRQVRSNEVLGKFEPEVALHRLLTDTGFVPRRNGRGKFVITPAARPTAPNPPRPLAPPPAAAAASDPVKLAPLVVEGRPDQPQSVDRGAAALGVRRAAGNLDLVRTEDGALPYTVFDRARLARSGVVNLNEFLERELLDNDAAARSPEQDASQNRLFAGSTNLSLRGYSADETIVLVNGRRLPEMLTSGSDAKNAPDVNLIPLSLVQQIEVLPSSASALYSGNPVGGVINIVLRPDADANATEVTTTYTNALRGFDASQSTVSLLHGRALLGGALRVRCNLNLTRNMPATEAELRFHRKHDRPPATLDTPIFRATPNIRSADGTPLFGAGTAAVTSVAPGADGAGGIAAFTARQGVRNLDFFKAPGGLAVSPDSVDNPYGRRQQRTTWFGSVVYDLTPWLQLGCDASHARTVVNRGYDVLTADLALAADAPRNPFRQEVRVSLNEVAAALGENYSEARMEFSSAVFGIMVRLPAEWRVSLDGQYAHNVTRYRGLARADGERWQQLVDSGRYQPLRDTQVHGPPAEFYDQVLVYRAGRGRFATLGDYNTLDAAIRATNSSLPLPTGRGILNFGGDYRRNRLEDCTDERRYADGTLADEPATWAGRTLQRYSAFGELQAPLLPTAWLPRWLPRIETDLAVRYVASDSARESNVSPTYGLKADLAGGFTVRGSFTTSNRFPTPHMSRLVLAPPSGDLGVDATKITDPVRREEYYVQDNMELQPDLLTEAAVTQTAGVVFRRGVTHRVRLAVDFLDTRKVNELVFLGPQSVMNLEALLPERVVRAPLAPGDNHRAGVVTAVRTGTTNLAWRRSQSWNTSVDYVWSECRGGTLELFGRLLYFPRYDLQTLPNSPVVDELRRPDGAASKLLKYRANFGASWSNQVVGFGMDGRYYHSRVLPEGEWSAQGHRTIDPFWQLDVYVQSDLARWLPWQSRRFGLRGQVRVNHVLGDNFPRYANEESGAGVQPYGDWRGRTIALSLTAIF